MKVRANLLPILLLTLGPVLAFQPPAVVYRRNGLVNWARHKHIIAGDEYRDYFHRMNQGDEERDDEGEMEENAWQSASTKSSKNSVRSGPKAMDEEEQAYYNRINAYRGAEPDLSMSSVTSRTDKPVSSTGAGRFLQYSLSESTRRPHFRLTGTSSDADNELLDSSTAMRKKMMQSWSTPDIRPLDVSLSSHGGPSCTTSYTRELTRLARERKPELALALFEQMQREGIAPVSATYAAVLRACNVAGNLSMALKVLQEMIAWELSEEGKAAGAAGVYVGGLNWAACLLCRSRRYKMVMDTLDYLHAQQVDLRPSTFNLLLGALGEEGRWEEILNVFERMKDYHVYADEQSYSCAITAYVAMGDIAEATRLLTVMSDQGLAARPEAVKTWMSVTNGSIFAAASTSGGGSGDGALPNVAL